MTEDISSRTRILIGDDGVEKLKNARVIVCGCGAVGGYAIEALVRSGIGNIRVVDKDVFSPSNLNRQILCTTSTVGRTKVEVACERARDINPEINIEGLDIYINEETVPDILDGEWDVLVDAIDTIGNKSKIDAAALEKGLPVFASMGAAMHLDPSKTQVATLTKTQVCPLASKLRKQMRDVDTRNMTCVFSTENVLVSPTERDDHGKSVLGSLPSVPGVFGFTLAGLTVEYLLQRKD